MKATTIFFLPLIVICFCACSKHIPAVYEVVGIDLNNLNNTGNTPTDAKIDSVPKQAYAIKITLNEEIRIKQEGDAQENGFMNDDQLTGLTIFSLNNFDGSHPAGAPLNEYFLTQLNNSATVADFVSKGQIGGGKLLAGSYTDSWSTEQFLYLMKAPLSPGKRSFVVKIELSDGRKFSDTVSVNLY